MVARRCSCCSRCSCNTLHLVVKAGEPQITTAGRVGLVLGDKIRIVMSKPILDAVDPCPDNNLALIKQLRYGYLGNKGCEVLILVPLSCLGMIYFLTKLLTDRHFR